MKNVSFLCSTLYKSTLFTVSGYLAVSKEGPAEHFFFPYRTKPPTR
jgi:hypothetical protein